MRFDGTNQDAVAAHGAPGGRAAEESFLRIPVVSHLRRPDVWRVRLETLVRLWNRRAQGLLAGNLAAGETILWALSELVEDVRIPLEERGSRDLTGVLRSLDRAELIAPTVAELARRAGMGVTTFRRAFRRATGKAPRAYIEVLRIERAARALAETDAAVHAIAQEEGYEDPYHFSRVFKRVMGLAPRAYRKKVRGLQ